MLKLSGKKDWEMNPLIISPKNCEIWANVDIVGRNVVYRDSNYKVVVDSFNKPQIVRLFTQATINEKKVGELICSEKMYFGKKYLFMNYVKIDDNHKGGGYSYRMMNSLLSILQDDVQGIITLYKQRSNYKEMYNYFSVLGGFVNEFGYLEIRNPKKL